MEENKMVKSKKMSKSAIAIIVLALLLVLSMVLGLTGAWFTKTGTTGSQSQVLDFGHINGALDGGEMQLGGVSGVVKAEGEAGKAVPGDKFTLTPVHIKYTANVDTFFFLDASAVSVQIKRYRGAGRTSMDESWVNATQAEIEELFGAAVYTNLQALVTIEQDVANGMKAAPASGESGTFTGDYADIKWFYYADASAADYSVKFDSVSSALTQMVVLTSVSNDTAGGSIDWTDAQIKLSYEVKTGVIQAGNIPGEGLAARALYAYQELYGIAHS